MKKFLILISFIILVFFALNIDFGSRVFEVNTPNKIFVDINKNLVFDEKEPLVINNINYISENIDLNKYPVFKVLSDDEKFFLENMAKEEARNLLRNRYVKIIDGDLKIRNKSYKEEMLKTKFVFDNTIQSQKELVENIKNINLDEYVILNLKNKKYHKLNCNLGRKSSKFKIIKLNNIKNTSTPCRSCHLPEIEHKANIKNYSVPVSKDGIYTDENIKIFFIKLNKIFKPDNLCKEEACKALKNEIDSAKYTIDFAIYGISNQPQIMNALINAHKRGVKIRRVYDFSEKKYYEDNDKLDKIIKTFKTDEEYDKNFEPALMHNKYFIFDGQIVWTGSSNISSTDLSGFNSNYVVIVNSKQIANKYKEDFEQMYYGKFHKSKKKSKPEYIKINSDVQIKPAFSPQDNILFSEIIPLIKTAKKYVYIPAFFITSKELEEALMSIYANGVDVKIINDATNAKTKYSVHKRLRKAGIKVKTENYAGKIHSKVIIIDDKYTIIGSMNFTRSGNSKNDENVLIIENSNIAKFMKSTFYEIWNKIPNKYELYDVKAESLDSIGSCYDGIDNDFDEKIDFEDEGCFIKSHKVK